MAGRDLRWSIAGCEADHRNDGQLHRTAPASEGERVQPTYGQEEERKGLVQQGVRPESA